MKANAHILAAALLAVLVFMCLFLSYRLWDQHQSLLSLRGQIRNIPEDGGGTAVLEARASELKQRIARYSFSQGDASKFIQQIHTLIREKANDWEVQLISASPGKTQSLEEESWGEVRIAARGRLKNLMLFLEDLRLEEPSLFTTAFELTLPNTADARRNSNAAHLAGASATLRGISRPIEGAEAE